MSNFSKRHGTNTVDLPIVIRQDAPTNVRNAIWSLAQQAGLGPIQLSEFILSELPVHDFEHDRPMTEMAKGALLSCDWPRVYDVTEGIFRRLAATMSPHNAVTFERHLNEFLRKAGVGWQMVSGQIQVRGAATFEETVRRGIAQLHDAGNTTTEGELREALHDLSRRPTPDITRCGPARSGGAGVSNAGHLR